ncbi:MAG: hypothetical protein JHC61_00020 [Burkholderiaceae bacterium]|nr:hypothetical protein [Burkholderiaceae bacterium]
MANFMLSLFRFLGFMLVLFGLVFRLVLYVQILIITTYIIFLGDYSISTLFTSFVLFAVSVLGTMIVSSYSAKK